MLLLVRRHREEQPLDAAIAPVAGSFLSSSAAAACWVINGELTLRNQLKPVLALVFLILQRGQRNDLDASLKALFELACFFC